MEGGHCGVKFGEACRIRFHQPALPRGSSGNRGLDREVHDASISAIVALSAEGSSTVRAAGVGLGEVHGEIIEETHTGCPHGVLRSG
jgi:hypothetical protein